MIAPISAELDSIFQAFANSKRRGMVQILSFRPATVTELADEFQLTLPAIHKHIRLLEEAKIIHRRKVGRTNYIALNAQSINVAQGWLMQFHTEWGSSKQTLENYIASMH